MWDGFAIQGPQAREGGVRRNIAKIGVTPRPI